MGWRELTRNFYGAKNSSTLVDDATLITNGRWILASTLVINGWWILANALAVNGWWVLTDSLTANGWWVWLATSCLSASSLGSFWPL